MPAVHPDYNEAAATASEATISTGLLDIALAATQDFVNEEAFRLLIFLSWVFHTALGTDCLGRNAISKLIRIGKEKCLLQSQVSSFGSNSRDGLETLLGYMLNKNPGGKGPLHDEKFARAVDEGLFELVIQILIKNHENGIHADSELSETIESMIEAAVVVSLQPATNESIKKRASRIREQLEKLQSTASLAKCAKSIQTLIATVEYIGVDKDDACEETSQTCGWCKTEIPLDEIKKCGKCKTAIYCGRECQANDWKKGGHNRECVVLDGWAETQKNLMKSANHLFLKESQNFVVQASLRGLDIVDCVVVLNFLESPPTIVTMHMSEFVSHLRPRK